MRDECVGDLILKFRLNLYNVIGIGRVQENGELKDEPDLGKGVVPEHPEQGGICVLLSEPRVLLSARILFAFP